MRVICVVACAVTSVAGVRPASADLTVRSRMVQEENGGRITEMTEYRKGLKMRTDSSAPGVVRTSTILDVGTGREVMLWHDSKSATEYDLDEMHRQPGPESVPAVSWSITPTSRTREIAGRTCRVYQVRSSSPFGGIEVSEPATVIMEGSMCVVKDGPEQADFVRISRAMAARARASHPMLMTLETANLGVPLATEMRVSIGGNQPNAERRQIMHYTIEVTSISMDSISDAIFEVPDGYTVTKR